MNEEAAMNATRLHNSMIQVYNRTKLVDYKPTSLSYSSLINCWAKSIADNKVDMSRSAYNELKHWYESTNDPMFEVTTVVHNALLDAMARSATPQNDLAWQCQSMLSQMKPDHRSFGTAIYACANTKTWSGALNATNLVKSMLNMGLKPNAVTFTVRFVIDVIL